VLGAFSLALVDEAPAVPWARSTEAMAGTILPTRTPTDPNAATPTPPPGTPTLVALQPTACPTPRGWRVYTIQPGDTLEGLAEQSGLSAAELRRSNCLSGVTLIPNAILYLPQARGATASPTARPTLLPTLPPTLPPTLTATLRPSSTLVACGPPPGWIVYVVRRGDTLFRLSIAYGVSMDMLRAANCMSGTGLIAGQTLYVPNVITRTPAVTSPPPSATPQPEPTETSAPPSDTPVPPTETVAPTATTPPATETVAPTEAPTAETTEATDEAPPAP
jgi:LysM repeat protein